MLNTKHLSFAAVFWLSSALCGGGSLAQAQSSADTSKQTPQIKADQRMANSATAVTLLRHISEARRLLAKGEQQQALSHINTGLMLIEHFGDRASVTIYPELGGASFLEPLETAQREGQERAADPSSLNRAPSVRLTVGGYTRVALDPRQVRTHLAAARAALNNQQPAPADTALLAVQTSVRLDSAAPNLPLVQARQQLALALERARLGQSQSTLDVLKAAADALNNYTRSPDAQRVGEVKALHSELMAFVQQGQPDLTGAGEKITAWWNRVADWLDEAPELTQK